MQMRARVGLAITVVTLALTGSVAILAQAPASIEFGSSRWAISDGKVVEHLGRRAFMGTATLGDAEFSNGIIEFDVAVTTDRARSYPGVTFRARGGGDWERFYVRPHRSALYGDVVQYVAAFHGVDSWQLYNGPGATSPGVVPVGQWVHVKVEVNGAQARLFLGDSPQPALVVPHLAHGNSRGAIGVMGPADGTAYFSNFTYRADETLVFSTPPPVDEVPGVVREWQVSKVFAADGIDLDSAPESQGLGDLGWTPLSANPGGLVDISRLRERTSPADLVFARTTLTAERDELRKFDLGYSDVVTVFVNGKPVFSGNSQYQGRDSSFLGIVGWFDAVFLPLRRGRNEITLALAEVSGGWGFMMRDATAVLAAEGVVKAWETPKAFAVPESVAYDPARDCFYVSNYDPVNPGAATGQAITKLGPDGRVIEQRFVAGLKNPTGLVVVGDTLYAVERQSVATIDIPRRAVISRAPLPNAGLPNDIAAAPDGTLYVTDSARAAIVAISGGTATVWLQDRRLARANGIVVDGNRLVVGTNGDGTLKAIDRTTREITTLAALGPGTIDGLAPLGEGRYLLSHNEGRLFTVEAGGQVRKLLDTTVIGRNIADFAIGHGLVVMPTFTDGRVMAYRIPGIGQ